MAAPSEGKQPITGEPREGPEDTTSSFGNFANFVETNKGNTENASVAAHSINRGWVLDSGASKHVTGNLKEFESYIRYPPHISRLYIQQMAQRNLLEELGQLNVILLLNYHHYFMCLSFL
jgi:hypothetical protein